MIAGACLMLGVGGCASYSPRLKYVQVESQVMRAELSYSVYLPPGFSKHERLPLVVFLHGGGDDPRSPDKYGLPARLDQAIRERRIPRAVVVFPQGDNGFWMNWYDGSRRYEDWVVDELMPELSKRYHTASCPQKCHVMGVSMGGHGALRFALHRPGQFASVTALSGPIFDTEQMRDFVGNRWIELFIPTHRIFGPPDPITRIEREDVFLRWRNPADLGGMSVFLAWADRDRPGIKKTNRKFSKHLNAKGIEHHAEEFRGRHAWVSWSPVIERALAYQVGRTKRRRAQ